MLIMNTVRERILFFIKDSQMTVADFERRIGVSSGYINNISRSIQPDKLEKISDLFPALNIDWLLLGKGSMKKSIIQLDIPKKADEGFSISDLKNIPTTLEVPEQAKEIVERILQAGLKFTSGDSDKNAESLTVTDALKKPLVKNEQTRPRVPLTATAGSLSGDSIGVTLEQCEQLPIIHQIPSYDFTMFIKGDSMSPRFESGDEIACRRIDQSRFIQWGKVHVLDTTQGFVIKRVYDDGDKIRCVSYNPEYADFSIPKEDILSMSLVVGLVSIMEM